jgi:hypothetical protein
MLIGLETSKEQFQFSEQQPWCMIHNKDNFDLTGSFMFFSDRLATIHQEMESWQPKNMFDIFRPPYRDRFSYYAQMSSLLIAIVGLFGLVLSIIQMPFAIEGFIISKKALAASQ